MPRLRQMRVSAIVLAIAAMTIAVAAMPLVAAANAIGAVIIVNSYVVVAASRRSDIGDAMARRINPLITPSA